MIFTIHDCGFVARSSQEVIDAGEVRIQKIVRLIRDSKFGIHDISRTELDRRTPAITVNAGAARNAAPQRGWHLSQSHHNQRRIVLELAAAEGGHVSEQRVLDLLDRPRARRDGRRRQATKPAGSGIGLALSRQSPKRTAAP